MVLTKKKYGFFDMITMSFKTSPMYSIIFTLKIIIDALLPTLSIFITADFLNLAIAIYNKEKDISSAYISVALIAGIMIYNALMNALMSFIESKRKVYFRRKLIPEIVEKHARLEYRHIENLETTDLINRVCPAFDGNVWGMYSNVLSVINFVIYISGIIITLFIQVWWIAIAMVILGVPIIYYGTKEGKKKL